jgi:hypothetical protein
MQTTFFWPIPTATLSVIIFGLGLAAGGEQASATSAHPTSLFLRLAGCTSSGEAPPLSIGLLLNHIQIINKYHTADILM